MKERNPIKQLAKHLHGTLLLWIFIGIQPFSVLAQENEYIPATGIKCAYRCLFVYPGFNIGVERPYKVIQVDKARSNRTKTIYKERYVAYNAGMYFHQDYHTNLLLQVEWIARRQYNKGIYLQSNIGTGLSKTFLDGVTYQVSENGEAHKVPMAGNFYGLLNMGGNIGYNLTMRCNQQVSLYLKPDLILLIPYNRFCMPVITLELGVTYSLKENWKANPKRYYRKKDNR